jgi:DNA-binding transcriptional LysR family regulator
VFLERISHGMGKRVNLRIQVGSYDAVCRMVVAGAGVAIVPRVFAQGHAGAANLRMLPLQDGGRAARSAWCGTTSACCRPSAKR